MFVNAKMYTVKMPAIGISAQKTIVELVGTATRLLAIVAATVTQSSSTTSAMLAAELCRKSAAATGGTAVTPIPTMPNQGASGFTAKVEGGTVFSAEGTVTDRIKQEGFNVLAGWIYRPGPDEYEWQAPSAINALRLFDATPGGQTFIADLTVGEIG